MKKIKNKLCILLKSLYLILILFELNLNAETKLVAPENINVFDYADPNFKIEGYGPPAIAPLRTEWEGEFKRTHISWDKFLERADIYVYNKWIEDIDRDGKKEIIAFYGYGPSYTVHVPIGSLLLKRVNGKYIKIWGVEPLYGHPHFIDIKNVLGTETKQILLYENYPKRSSVFVAMSIYNLQENSVKKIDALCTYASEEDSCFPTRIKQSVIKVLVNGKIAVVYPSFKESDYSNVNAFYTTPPSNDYNLRDGKTKYDIYKWNKKLKKFIKFESD